MRSLRLDNEKEIFNISYSVNNVIHRLVDQCGKLYIGEDPIVLDLSDQLLEQLLVIFK